METGLGIEPSSQPYAAGPTGLQPARSPAPYTGHTGTEAFSSQFPDWTVLLIVLFVTKSILDGAIRNVPWPLVGLLGFSQAGYLVPKLATHP